MTDDRKQTAIEIVRQLIDRAIPLKSFEGDASHVYQRFLLDCRMKLSGLIVAESLKFLDSDCPADSREAYSWIHNMHANLARLERQVDRGGSYLLRSIDQQGVSGLVLVRDNLGSAPILVEPERGAASPEAPIAFESPTKNAVFIVHGRDEHMKKIVACFVEELGLEPIILHEQVNAGATVIEKFEAHAKRARYAVVLFSPDDLGALNHGSGQTNPLQPRARQNVVFELGFFFGQLGRKGVCVLLHGGVEKPSDFEGVLYLPYGEDQNWKHDLLQELKHAGMSISNKDLLQQLEADEQKRRRLISA